MPLRNNCDKKLIVLQRIFQNLYQYPEYNLEFCGSVWNLQIRHFFQRLTLFVKYSREASEYRSLISYVLLTDVLNFNVFVIP